MQCSESLVLWKMEEFSFIHQQPCCRLQKLAKMRVKVANKIRESHTVLTKKGKSAWMCTYRYSNGARRLQLRRCCVVCSCKWQRPGKEIEIVSVRCAGAPISTLIAYRMLLAEDWHLPGEPSECCEILRC